MRKRIFVIHPNHNVEVKEATLTQKIVQSVTAAYHGILKEMDFTAQSEWRSVTWNCSEYSDPRFFIPYPEMHRQLILRNPTLQIIIHFEDTEQSVSTICKGERQVLNHLSKLLETQSMADVNFVVNGERIGAHSAIVVSGSPVICAMLEKDKFLEGVAKEVKIDDIEPSVFKDILRYLYTGRVLELKEDEMIELFVAADKYQIEALKDQCEESLQWKINLESVIHYLVLAHIHTAPQLLEASLKFLEANKEDIWPLPEWKELVQSYPDLFYSASRRLFN
jgi:speckle-type POZ protein